MKRSTQFTLHGWLFILIILVSGCKDAAPVGPAAEGRFTLCHYKQGLDADGYASARISYPCDLSADNYPALTLTGGYTNIKEQMYWLANHLTRHGYIVITATPNDPLGGINHWVNAHRGAFHQLITENQRVDSPISGRIDLQRIGVAGYSNGGAAALLVANELGNQVTAVVSMAPYFFPAPPDFSSLQANSLTMVGTFDTTSFPSIVAATHDAMPVGYQHTFAELHWVSHFDWIAFGRFHNKFKTLITAWLSTHLAGDNQWESYLSGDEHQQQIEESWYKTYSVR